MIFKNKQELLNYFSDEAKAVAHYEQLRWGGKICCVHCGSTKIYRTNRGFSCGEKLCLKKFTTKTGTIFEDSKIPFKTWFIAIYECTSNKKGKSSHQLARDLGVTQKTAWFILHRIREMLQDKEPILLRGTVSVDESYVGGATGNKHRRKIQRDESGKTIDVKSVVFGAVEKQGKAVLRVVDSATKAQILPVLEKHIEKGSFMVSDESHIYSNLSRTHQYSHASVNHSQGEYVRDGFHTNNIENVFSLLKRGIDGIYHQVSPEHLNAYCIEFAFRYNSRKITDQQRWNLALTQCDGITLKYDILTARGQANMVENKVKAANEAYEIALGKAEAKKAKIFELYAKKQRTVSEAKNARYFLNKFISRGDFYYAVEGYDLKWSIFVKRDYVQRVTGETHKPNIERIIQIIEKAMKQL